MLTLQSAKNASKFSLTTEAKSTDKLLSKEWLLSNSRGGYASSTVLGCNTRRYHGLLIGSLNPPANRIMALAQCLEMVICGDGSIFNLSGFEFSDKFGPGNFSNIKGFRQDVGVHFDYQAGKTELTKSIYLLPDNDTVAVVYEFTKVPEPVDFVIRPFVGLRDYHSLQKSYAHFCYREIESGLLVRHNVAESCELFMSCPTARFEKDEQWWFNFLYREDKQRGQDFSEDLWTPGFFKCQVDSPKKIIFWANLSSKFEPGILRSINIRGALKALKTREKRVISTAKTADRQLQAFCMAADRFICERQIGDKLSATVLAGFPWFADWGRDTFISFPGLLLEIGRFEEAKSVLVTFAGAADNGMIPNRFDDRDDTVHFNSVDASLWFINAAFQYLNATGDCKTFTEKLLPVIRCIIDSYQNGTLFGICADSDGLIKAGDQTTQLTWMDAKYEQTAFTPRYGKAVEINALWYNSLCLLANFYTERDSEQEKIYKVMAEKVGKSFRDLFWNNEAGCLYDCILPDGSVDASLRPNQIFAVSLPFSSLTFEQQKAVVDVVQEKLLTPYGLRTLNPSAPRYKGVYAGTQHQRDEAYHQGTVWAYLLGPFVESYLKVNEFSKNAREQAAGFIEPLLRHFEQNGCIGQVSEIFDGDFPHKPKGCFAQAWSLAELTRAYKMINS